MSIKDLDYLYSHITRVCGYIVIPIPVNTDREYVTYYNVPSLSEASIQVKRNGNLRRGFKEIAHHSSVIVWPVVERNAIHYCVLGEIQPSFEFYGSIPHEIKNDKKFVITFKIAIPVVVLRVDQYLTMGIDLPSAILKQIQILAMTINIHEIMFPFLGDRVSQDRSSFITKLLAIFWAEL